MFNGIVEAIGRVTEIIQHGDGIGLSIATDMNCADIKIGDSVSVNGVCLTLTACETHHLFATAVPETLRVTNLGHLVVGSEVNLEKSLAANARIGGHFVQGHVDAVAKILTLDREGERTLLVKISMPQALSKYIVNKGYITIDGMSITVIQSTPEWFSVTLIPHTQHVTIAKHYQVGSYVNVEVDSLGKYVEKILGGYVNASVC